jgi:trimethylamine-N-oxide reductase (cytochrome c) cytochrome c-type subunit TorY
MIRKLFKSLLTKTGLLVLFILLPALVIGSHEISVRHFQDVTCVTCHEMREPIRKWKESGTVTNHNNCAGCHYDATFEGWMAMNKSAIKQLAEHFKRDPNEPIKPPEEPLILEADKQPGYWSLVPNSRCFQCKNVKNHLPIDQLQIHQKLIKNIANQPCKDCHNHEMRKGQKFFEKVTPKQDQGGASAEKS